MLSKNAARTFADVDFDDLNGTGQITALFGFRGAERDKAGDPIKMIAVFHRGLRGDTEKALDVPLVRRLRDRFKLHTAGGNFLAPVDVTPIEDTDYRDPVGDPRERWLAAFAPVGRTGYVLVVATPHERALEPSRPLFTLLTMYGGLLNLSFLVICALAALPPLQTRIMARS